MIQLTGEENYRTFGRLVGIDLVTNPDRAADPAVSLHLACAFWARARVNGAIDSGDFALARRRVNGGTIGLHEIATCRKRVMAILN
jgi:putative chitinase